MENDLISRSALGTGKAKRECFEDPKYADGWNSAIDIINNAPAVDAVVLPVRPGQMVWILNHRFAAEIEEICVREDGVFAVWTEYDRSPELTEVWDDGEFDIEEIGNTVFLTFEELEKAVRQDVSSYGDRRADDGV